MKKLLFLLTLLISSQVFAQTPRKYVVNADSLRLKGALSFGGYNISVTPLGLTIAKGNAPAAAASYDLTLSLPVGYVTDGTVNYFSYLQAGMNAHSRVKMPAFPVLIDVPNGGGLTPTSGQTIDFPAGAQLIMKGNAWVNSYGHFKINGISNVTINNPNLVGDMLIHTGSITGQFGSGIYIYGGSNIIINGGSITKCSQDGIYIARQGSPSLNSSNILINNVTCNNNGRNGMSASSCVGLTINNFIANGNITASPFCGIDLEPNTNLDILDQVVINGLTTNGNKNGTTGGKGISIGLKGLYQPDVSQGWNGVKGSGTGVATLNKVCNITVNNLTDVGSNEGFLGSLILPSGYSTQTITVTGGITFNNPSISTEKFAPADCESISANFFVNTYNTTLRDSTGSLLTGTPAMTYLTHNSAEIGTQVFFNTGVNPSPVTTVANTPVIVSSTTPPSVTFNGDNIVDSQNASIVKSNVVVTTPSLNFITPQTDIPGSTSGQITWEEPHNGNIKKVYIYFNALVGTATFTFPTPFLFTPKISPDAGITGYTVTTTGFTANAGSSQTGYVILEGY